MNVFFSLKGSKLFILMNLKYANLQNIIYILLFFSFSKNEHSFKKETFIVDLSVLMELRSHYANRTLFVSRTRDYT